MLRCTLRGLSAVVHRASACPQSSSSIVRIKAVVSRSSSSGSVRTSGAEDATEEAKAAAGATGVNKDSAAEHVVKSETINVVGRYYQDLVYRGRKTNKLSLGDLRKLLQMCTDASSVKYGLSAVELYQIKGQDFSEEVNSHFISMCIRGGSPLLAVKHMSFFKNRLGARTTQTSLHRLVEACKDLKDDDLVLLITALETISIKGAKMNQESGAVILRACIANSNADLYNKTATSIFPKFFDKATLDKLMEANPAPIKADTEAVAAVEGDGGEAAIAGDAKSS